MCAREFVRERMCLRMCENVCVCTCEYYVRERNKKFGLRIVIPFAKPWSVVKPTV